MGSTFSRRDMLALSSMLAMTPAAPRAAPLAKSNLADFAKRVEVLRERNKLEALGVAATLHGKPVFVRAFGRASLPFSSPANSATLFHIGSVSKHVTAAAVLRLLEARKISVDEPLGRFVHGLPFDWGNQPIRRLLTHTSGIPDYEEGFDWDRPFDRAGFLKMAATRASNFPSGAAWSYSNTNYVLLGFLVEDLSGKSYREYVTEELLRPAKVPHARVDAAEDVIVNRAEPYLVTPEGVRHATRMNSDVSAMPDGGILMSASDFAAWNQSIDNGPALSTFGRAQMFSAATLTTGRQVPYGFGWLVEELGVGRPFCWHTGSVPGFLTFILKSPATGVDVLILSNVDAGTSRPLRQIGQELAEAIAPGSTPYSLMPVPDRNPELTAAAKTLVVHGDVKSNPKQFAPEMLAQIEGPIGADAVMMFSARNPDSFQLVHETVRPNERIRRYRLTYGERFDHISFCYTPDNLIYCIFGI